jgi:hypothetical protein
MITLTSDYIKRVLRLDMEAILCEWSSLFKLKPNNTKKWQSFITENERTSVFKEKSFVRSTPVFDFFIGEIWRK